MNSFIVFASALLVVASAAPSGLLGGAIVGGPGGILVNNGLGLGLGLGNGAILGGRAILAGPAVGLGLGLGNGIVGLGGAAAITNGGGVIGASAHGATIAGPGTAPVVVAGPSGKIVADGLWGPTANIGLLGQGHW